jgi:hypothetical protein
VQPLQCALYTFPGSLAKTACACSRCGCDCDCTRCAAPHTSKCWLGGMCWDMLGLARVLVTAQVSNLPAAIVRHWNPPASTAGCLGRLHGTQHLPAVMPTSLRTVFSFNALKSQVIDRALPLVLSADMHCSHLVNLRRLRPWPAGSCREFCSPAAARLIRHTSVPQM